MHPPLEMAFGRKREPIIALDHPDYPSFPKAEDEIFKQKPDVLIHAGDLFVLVEPRTRVYTTVPGALDRLHAAGIHSLWHFR
jgi:hypothetical protein